jgi:hypothetical protein
MALFLHQVLETKEAILYLVQLHLQAVDMVVDT